MELELNNAMTIESIVITFLLLINETDSTTFVAIWYFWRLLRYTSLVARASAFLFPCFFGLSSTFIFQERHHFLFFAYYWCPSRLSRNLLSSNKDVSCSLVQFGPVFKLWLILSKWTFLSVLLDYLEQVRLINSTIRINTWKW